MSQRRPPISGRYRESFPGQPLSEGHPERAEDGSSDLDDFIVSDEDDSEELSESESDSDKAPKKRVSLLSEKFRQFDEEFASGSEGLPSVDSGEEGDENNDDVIQVDSSSSEGSVSDGVDEGSHVGKLYCAVCRDYFGEDDFSAIQRRITRDPERFCLRHTSTAAFNQDFSRPERGAVGLRMRPSSSSPANKAGMSKSTRITSPAFRSTLDPAQGKLDSYFESQRTSAPRDGGMSALKKRSLNSDMSVQGSAAKKLTTPASHPKEHADGSGSRRRTPVIVIDEEDCDGAISEVKCRKGEVESESEEEWCEEPVKPPSKQVIRQSRRDAVNIKHNKQVHSEDKSFSSNESDEAEFQYSSSDDECLISNSDSEASLSDEPKRNSDNGCKRKYTGKKNSKALKTKSKNKSPASLNIDSSNLPKRVTRASAAKGTKRINYNLESCSDESSSNEIPSPLNLNQRLEASTFVAASDISRKKFQDGSSGEKAVTGRKTESFNCLKLSHTVQTNQDTEEVWIDDVQTAMIAKNSNNKHGGSRFNNPEHKQANIAHIPKKRKVVMSDDSDDDGEWNG